MNWNESKFLDGYLEDSASDCGKWNCSTASEKCDLGGRSSVRGRDVAESPPASSRPRRANRNTGRERTRFLSGRRVAKLGWGWSYLLSWSSHDIIKTCLSKNGTPVVWSSYLFWVWNKTGVARILVVFQDGWICSATSMESSRQDLWFGWTQPVSYTHLTLPTNREV